MQTETFFANSKVMQAISKASNYIKFQTVFFCPWLSPFYDFFCLLSFNPVCVLFILIITSTLKSADVLNPYINTGIIHDITFQWYNFIFAVKEPLKCFLNNLAYYRVIKQEFSSGKYRLKRILFKISIFYT